jgi:hypothetical protein
MGACCVEHAGSVIERTADLLAESLEPLAGHRAGVAPLAMLWRLPEFSNLARLHGRREPSATVASQRPDGDPVPARVHE